MGGCISSKINDIGVQSMAAGAVGVGTNEIYDEALNYALNASPAA